MTNTDYEKKGYLNEPFKLFHLTDHEATHYSCHYHDFFKIMLFISGDVDYFIEGITYRLEPFDIVLIGAGDVHRPVIRSLLSARCPLQLPVLPLLRPSLPNNRCCTWTRPAPGVAQR